MWLTSTVLGTLTPNPSPVGRGERTRAAIGCGTLHIVHRHHAIASAAAHARQIHAQLARLRAHGRHRLHAADGYCLLATHGVGTLHGADHGAAVFAFAFAGFRFRRGFVGVGGLAAFIFQVANEWRKSRR